MKWEGRDKELLRLWYTSNGFNCGCKKSYFVLHMICYLYDLLYFTSSWIIVSLFDQYHRFVCYLLCKLHHQVLLAQWQERVAHDGFFKSVLFWGVYEGVLDLCFLLYIDETCLNCLWFGQGKVNITLLQYQMFLGCCSSPMEGTSIIIITVIIIIIYSIVSYNPEQWLTMYGVTNTVLFGLTKVYIYIFCHFTSSVVTDQCQIILILFTCI